MTEEKDLFNIEDNNDLPEETITPALNDEEVEEMNQDEYENNNDDDPEEDEEEDDGIDDCDHTYKKYNAAFNKCSKCGSIKSVNKEDEEEKPKSKPISNSKSKGTDNFKKVIQDYLEKRASEDELFAPHYKKEGKNIDDCIAYILTTVQKSGCNGFSDDEVYSMAVHYYIENELKISKIPDCQVIVNHHVELTEEEKKAAKQKAIDDIIAEQRKSMLKKPETPKKEEKKLEQTSLF